MLEKFCARAGQAPAPTKTSSWRGAVNGAPTKKPGTADSLPAAGRLAGMRV